ncbi:WD40 repeat domain-containing protein (plasmid) [Phormidium sp. CLA17]|uniref:WD40 repeat domain-containing protein n=1 Tax=Leptolyngbya sp. Cla-17 TaxID=2803751 RepID=UPI001491E5AF|nr:WD40 repeat domain-containing protein [Leptolyngbya sp. Cla-17]MBM0745265.1 WD40 repeat domain-containing protein [Leptolyngbya sp. Cla-17]
MKAAKTVIISIVGAGAMIAVVLGIMSGINYLGGLLWRDEALVCRKERLNALAVTADGNTLIAGGTHIRLWDIATGKKLYGSTTVRYGAGKMAGLSPAVVSALVITPDQRLFISAVSSLGAIGSQGVHEIQVWDLARHQPIRFFIFNGHRDRVRFLAVSPDSQTLVSQDDSGVIQLRNLATGQVKKTWNTEVSQRFPILISSDGKVFTSMGKDGTVTLWDMATGNAVSKLKADPSHTPLAISANNKTLLTQNAGDVKRFRAIATGAELKTLKGSYIESAFAVSPDRKQGLITIDAGINRYDLVTGTELQTFNTDKFYNAIAITPDGSSFLTLDPEDNYTLWNLATGTRMRQLEGKAGRGDKAFAGAKILVNAANHTSNRITLWDLQTGKRIRKFCNQ